jgi:hypothetical protein
MERAFTHDNIASPRAWCWNRLCHQRGTTSDARPGPKVLFFASLGKLSEQPAFVMIGKWCLDCPTT